MPETEGNLRLGFPPKHPNMSEKVSGGAEPQPLAQLPGQNPGKEQETLAGVGEFCRGEGQDFSSILWGWPFAPRNPSS